jgi:hypothetical protein
MELRLYDISMSSINPTSLLGTLSAVPPTGGGAVTVGSATTPSLAGPVIEPIYRVVADIGTAGVLCPAALMIGQQFVATNTGGAQFKQLAATASVQLPRFSYGAVVSPPTNIGGPNGTFVQNVPGGQSLICVEGMAVVTAGATGMVAGGLYGSSGATAGTLITNAGTAPGAVLAIGISVIAAGAVGIAKVGGF